MIMLACLTHSIPSSRVSIGPGPRDTAPPLSLHVHMPPACTYASLHTEKVKLGTPNRAPQNHDLPIWLVADSSSSWSREGLTL